MENKTEEFNKILNDCGYGSESQAVVINNISILADKLPIKQYEELLAYIILSINDLEIIKNVIILSDNYKADCILASLSDFLLKKYPKDVDCEPLINLKVLCAKAISNYKLDANIQILLYCLNNKSENYKVRLACADALGRIGDKYAVTSLIDIINDDEEKSVYVKESATFALGLIGDTAAIDPLIQIMETKNNIFNGFAFLKEKIIEALGRLNFNNKKILKVLKNSIYDVSPMVRINSIEALMNSNFEEAEDLIRITLKDSDSEVQRNALIALYNMIGRDILDEVISLPSYSDFLKNEAQSMINEYEDDDV